MQFLDAGFVGTLDCASNLRVLVPLPLRTRDLFGTQAYEVRGSAPRKVPLRLVRIPICNDSVHNCCFHRGNLDDKLGPTRRHDGHRDELHFAADPIAVRRLFR